MIASLLRRAVQVPTDEEDRQLLTLAQGGDLSARNELIMRHMPFVIKVASEHYAYRQRPRYVTRDDLIQVCVIGVIHAIRKYNPARATTRFIYYAKYWMRDYMDKALYEYKLYRVPPSVLLQYRKGILDRPGSAKTKQAVEWFQEMQYLPEDKQVCDKRMTPDEEAILHEELLLL